MADWNYGVHCNAEPRYRTDDWLAEVHQKCAHLRVRAEALERGLIIEDEKVLPNGEIELVLCERI